MREVWFYQRLEVVKEAVRAVGCGGCMVGQLVQQTVWLGIAPNSGLLANACAVIGNPINQVVSKAAKFFWGHCGILLCMEIIEKYYAAFNAHNTAAMLECLTEDVQHEISQGGTELGKAAFAAFMGHMDECYSEQVLDLVLLQNPDGTRAAAEFRLEGRYLKTDGAFPEAKGQTYTLRVGAFFEVRDGKIARVSNHYNLRDWLRQVGGV
jgi:steroid delta-isomerase-like uncharacterized protein